MKAEESSVGAVGTDGHNRMSTAATTKKLTKKPDKGMGNKNVSDRKRSGDVNAAKETHDREEVQTVPYVIKFSLISVFQKCIFCLKQLHPLQ